MQNNCNYRLSRLNLFKNVDQNTPLIVLQDLANINSLIIDDHQFYDSDTLLSLIITINNDKVSEIDNKYDSSNLADIARYVNHRCNWKKGSLMKAFDFIYDLVQHPDKLTSLDLNNFNIGYPNVIQPIMLDSTILYAMCKAYNINTNFNTSLKQMEQMLRLYQNLNNNPINMYDLRNKLNKSITDCTDISTLVNINNLLQQCTNNIKRNYDPQDLSINNLISADTFLINHPDLVQDTVSAVVAMVKEFMYDISSAQNPLQIYQQYQQTKTLPLEYNNNLNDPEKSINLNLKFNPNLPVELYTKKQLRNLCKIYGYRDLDKIAVEEYYGLLQSSLLLNNFTFYPIQNKIINGVDFHTLEHYQNYNKDQIIYYGQADWGYYWYLIESLQQYWQNEQEFINPLAEHNSKFFDEREINRLQQLLQYTSNSNSTSKSKSNSNSNSKSTSTSKSNSNITYYINDSEPNNSNSNCNESDFTSLSNTMQEIIELDKSYPVAVVKFLNDSIKIESVQIYYDILDTFYKLALYMRGWKIKGFNNKLKIITSNCTHITDIDVTQHDDNDITNFINMSENVTKQYQQLINYDNINSNANDIFMQLPLYNYVNKHLKPIRDTSYGKSIADRLDICFKHNDDVNACLRFTSNILLYTYYFYIKLLDPDYKTDFEPKQVHWIS